MNTIRTDVASVLAQIADDIEAQALLALGQTGTLQQIARQIRAVYKPMVPCALVTLPEPDGTGIPDRIAPEFEAPYWGLAATGDRLYVADASRMFWTINDPDTAREWLEHDALAMLAAARWTP